MFCDAERGSARRLAAFEGSCLSKKEGKKITLFKKKLSCDGWVCGFGAVGASSIFGMIRGAGAFAAVLPTIALVSRMQLAQHACSWGLKRNFNQNKKYSNFHVTQP
jgi:hypothetical protein